MDEMFASASGFLNRVRPVQATIATDCLGHKPARDVHGPVRMTYTSSTGMLTLTPHRRRMIPMGLILLIVLVLLLVGALPTWPHSRQWGYAPSGTLGTLLLVLLILVLLGYVPRSF